VERGGVDVAVLLDYIPEQELDELRLLGHDSNGVIEPLPPFGDLVVG
jgi:hypothetical protein